MHYSAVGDGWRSYVGYWHTLFFGEACAGDKLEVEYSISGKKEGNSERYLVVQIQRISDNKLVIVSRKNLERIKK